MQGPSKAERGNRDQGDAKECERENCRQGYGRVLKEGDMPTHSNIPPSPYVVEDGSDEK